MQSTLLDIKAERKARQIQLNQKIKKQQQSLVQAESKTYNNAEILEAKTKFVTVEKEYSHLVIEMKIYQQKIEQSKEESDELSMEMKEVQQTETIIKEMISNYNKQFQEFENLKKKVNNEPELVKKLQEQETEFKKELVIITKQLEELQNKKKQITSQLVTKEAEVKEWTEKTNEIKKELKAKGIEVQEIKENTKKVIEDSSTASTTNKQFTSNVAEKVKTVEKKEIIEVNWDVSVKSLERKKIITKKLVKVYTEQYYLLEESVKEGIVWQEILLKAIEGTKIEISKFDRFLANSNNMELESQIKASRQSYAEQLTQLQKEKETVEQKQSNLVSQMDIEKGKCVQAGKIYSGDDKLPFEAIDSNKLTGKYSKLYYLLEMRFNQLNKRLVEINEKLKTNLNSFEQRSLLAEKKLRERERVVVESDMRIEKDKIEGVQEQINDETRYSVKYYQLEKTYNAVVLQISVSVTKLVEIEQKIKIEKEKLVKADGEAKAAIEKTIASYENDKKILETQKMQLVSLQQSYQKQMQEEKQQGGTKVATIASIKGSVVAISTLEKYHTLIQRYSEIALQIKDIFDLLQKYRTKIDQIYVQLEIQNGYTTQAQQLLSELAKYNEEVDSYELKQTVLRKEQEEILKAIQELLDALQNEKEFKYKSKFPKEDEQGFAYKISSVSTIPSKIKSIIVPEVKEEKPNKPIQTKNIIPDVINKEVEKYLKPTKTQTKKIYGQYEDDWEWYWEEYLDEKQQKQYRKKYREQPSGEKRIDLGDENYNYDTDDFYNSGDYIDQDQEIVKVPLAKNQQELNYGYADRYARTYYKTLDSNKITTFAFPLISVKSSLKLPISTAKSSLKFPLTSVESTIKLPGSDAQSSIKFPETTATSSINLPEQTAESSLRIPISTAESTLKMPDSSADSTLIMPESTGESTVKFPESSAESSMHLPQSTSKSTNELPKSIGTSTIRFPASSAASDQKLPKSSATSSIKLPSSSATSSISMPDSSGASSIHLPLSSSQSDRKLGVSTAKSTKKLAKTSAKSNLKLPKMTVKSTLKKQQAKGKLIKGKPFKKLSIDDDDDNGAFQKKLRKFPYETTSKSTINLPKSTAKSTLHLDTASAQSTLRLPHSSAKTDQRLPKSSAKSTKKLGQSSAESTVKLPKSTSESSQKLSKSSAESTKKLGSATAETTLGIPQTSSESTRKFPKTSVKSTKTLGSISAESTYKIPQTSSESTKKIPYSSSKSTISQGKTSAKSTHLIPKITVKSTLKNAKQEEQQEVQEEEEEEEELKPLKLNFQYDTSVYSVLPIPEASLKSTMDFPDVDLKTNYKQPKFTSKTNSYTLDSSLKSAIKRGDVSDKSNGKETKTSMDSNQNFDSSIDSTRKDPYVSKKSSTHQTVTKLDSSSKLTDSSLKSEYQDSQTSTKSSSKNPLKTVKQSQIHPDTSLKSSLTDPDIATNTNYKQPKFSTDTSSKKSDATAKSSTKSTSISRESNSKIAKTSIDSNKQSESSVHSSQKNPDISKKSNTYKPVTKLDSSSKLTDSSLKSENKKGIASTKSSNKNQQTTVKQSQVHPDASLKSSADKPDISMQTNSKISKSSVKSSHAKSDASLKSTADTPTVTKQSTHALPVASLKDNRKMTSTLRSNLGKSKNSVKSGYPQPKLSSKSNLKTLLQKQVYLQLKGRSFPSAQKNEGRLKLKTFDEQQYSDKYYDLLSDSEMLLTKYEILIKRIFELKISMFLYSEKLKKQIFSTVEIDEVKKQLVLMENELKVKEIEELNQRKMIVIVIKAMEEEKLASMEKLIGRKLNNELHTQMEQFADLKAQYTLIIIRMKIITESKHSITLRIRTLFSEIATNKLQAIELKIRYYELLLLNTQNLELDKESIVINEDKGKIFKLMQELAAKINKEEALGMKVSVENEIEIVDMINDLSASGKGQFTHVTQTTTPVERGQANEGSTKSPEELELEKEILELAGSQLTLTEKILKIIKITTMLKKQLTILVQYQFSTKQLIQKHTSEQFSVKMQLGIAKIEWDIYVETIKKLRIEYEQEKSKGNTQKMNEIAEKINIAVKQLEVPKGRAWDLNAQYEQLQEEIDDYLAKVNSITEKIIIFKKQLIYYEQEQRKLEDEELKIEKEENEKKKIEQIKIKAILETEETENENLKKQITTKKTERDIACTEPAKTKKTEPQKQDDSWLEDDYGWSKFMQIRITAAQKGKYVSSDSSKKESYAKGAFDDGVFRIRQKLNEILLFEIQKEQTVGGTLFKKIKAQVDDYVKVLMNQEQILQKNEITIQQRILKIQEKEITVKKEAQIVTDDLEKCKLEFPAIQEEAEKIRGKDVTESILKEAKKMEEQLTIIRNKNIDEEKKLEERHKQIQEKIQEIEIRKKKIEELEKLQVTKTQQIIEKKIPEIIPVNNNKIQNSDVVITKSKTIQSEQALKLEGQEEELDKQVKELESKSDKSEDLSDSLDEETAAIESNLEKLKIEEQKIVKEKNQLRIQREQIENEIEKCKINFSKIQNKLLSMKDKQSRKTCLLNKNKFQEEKNQLDHDINAYNDLETQIQDEKNQYYLYQKQLIILKKPTKDQQYKLKQVPHHQVRSLLQKSMAVIKSSNGEFITLLSEVKGEVKREELWKNIHKALNLVNELTENNAKQARMLKEQIRNKLVGQEKVDLLKSMELIQISTEKITSKLNLILSKYSEDQVKLQQMINQTVGEIDQLYELTKKQSRIIQSAEILAKNGKKLLKMKDKCQMEQKHQNLKIQQKRAKGFLPRLNQNQ